MDNRLAVSVPSKKEGISYSWVHSEKTVKMRFQGYSFVNKDGKLSDSATDPVTAGDLILMGIDSKILEQRKKQEVK